MWEDDPRDVARRTAYALWRALDELIDPRTTTVAFSRLAVAALSQFSALVFL
jgi:hypothetical protein